jgi:NAD(P)-dependent dehydrogenase (short-subunit alcohol dehydrogenase family)
MQAPDDAAAAKVNADSGAGPGHDAESEAARSAAPRTVLVTGGARRLGRAIAIGLAEQGWQVAVHYRSSAEDAIKTVAECARSTGGAAAFDADFSDEDAVRGLVPRVVGRFGRLDAVVNSASTFEHDDAESFSYAMLNRHLLGNTAAPILLAQALHKHLQARQADGAVVNLLDQKLWNPNPDFLSYTLSKAALEAANTLLAQALAPRVRVVGVAPGLTITSHMLSEDKFRDLHKLSPLGRSSTPADVVASVRFALDNRSITGTTLLVDGGQHLMRFERDFSLM